VVRHQPSNLNPNVESVLIELPLVDLAKYGEMIPVKDRIYLAPDVDCTK
jgi:hypothetical protein